jgi:hypothetical protein
MNLKIAFSCVTVIILFLFSLILAFSPSINTFDVRREITNFELPAETSLLIINEYGSNVRFIEINLDIGSSFRVRYKLLSDVDVQETIKIFTNSSVSFNFSGIAYFNLESTNHYIKGIIEIHRGYLMPSID